MLPTAWCRSWSKFVVVNKIPSVQITHFIMVSCSVADDLQTVLIACNIVGVIESRSGIRSLPNTWALATPTSSTCSFDMEAWSGDGMPLEI